MCNGNNVNKNCEIQYRANRFPPSLLANLDKNHFLANARKKFLRDEDADLINSVAISSILRRNKQNEISIRLTREIDIRKSFPGMRQ
ncbi:hypothetical protein HGM15179_006887 [Zosterops borbonicus]|uniref:Uncharacterized protein n=1 Tax=Zosterops borbonicus TaxID=364589 RepID=A0A8K1GJQ7_9PASS|nr:hypothetical protein HGM15179_006887 [Zosterops borbonicus]